MPVINESELQTGNLKGADHGATISLILDHSDPGQGPRLHRHPYDETWVVIEGNLTFHSGDERLKAGPGDIVIVPPGAAHQIRQRRSGTLAPGVHPRKPDDGDGVVGMSNEMRFGAPCCCHISGRLSVFATDTSLIRGDAR